MKSLIIIFALLTVFGCASRPERPNSYAPPVQPVSAGSYVNWRQFGLIIDKATSVYVYEGTPRNYNTEKRGPARSIIMIDGFEFYADAKRLDASKIEAINELIRNRTAFLDYGGMKLCGGFHPDYCIEWRFEEDGQISKSRAFACLGCHEWRLVDNMSALHSDMADFVTTKLISLLKD
jgi:hypothetical protein